jgi:hypothetical protein
MIYDWFLIFHSALSQVLHIVVRLDEVGNGCKWILDLLISVAKSCHQYESIRVQNVDPMRPNRCKSVMSLAVNYSA